MKQADNAAVLALKSQADRMADYLASAGYVIKRTHLMEACARYEGARDYRTMRAQLSNKATSAKPVAPELGEKCVRVYTDFHVRSTWGKQGPDFCWFDVNQQWAEKVLELRQAVIHLKLTEAESSFCMPDWHDESGADIFLQGITVTEREFWFSGSLDDSQIETNPMNIDLLLERVVATTAKELFFLAHRPSIEELMKQLGRDEDHPDYVSEEAAPEYNLW